MRPALADRSSNRSRYRRGKRAHPRIPCAITRQARQGNHNLTYSMTNTSTVAVGPVRQPSATTSIPPAISFNPDRKSTRLNSSHLGISYAVFCLKKKKNGGLHLGVLVGAAGCYLGDARRAGRGEENRRP